MNEQYCLLPQYWHSVVEVSSDSFWYQMNQLTSISFLYGPGVDKESKVRPFPLLVHFLEEVGNNGELRKV